MDKKPIPAPLKGKNTDRDVIEINKKYSGVFDNLIEGCLVVGPDWRYLYINDALVKHAHKFRGELLGRTLMEVHPGVEKTGMFAKLQLCMKEQVPHLMESEFVFPGCEDWFEIRMEPVPEGVLAFFLDITERKKAREALRESEQRLITTLKSIGDAVIVTDLQGKVILLNFVAEKLIGWSENAGIGQPIKKIFNIINEKTGKPVEDLVSKVIEKGMIVGLANHTVLVKRDGSLCPIEDSGAPIRDSEGNIIGVVLVFRDITERRRAENALRESQALYRTIIENSNDMIWTLDEKGQFVFFNKRSEELSGRYLKDWVGRDFSPLIVEEDLPGVVEIFKKTMAGNPQQYEVRVKRPDGSLLMLSVNTAPLYSDGKVTGTVSFGRDITEYRKAENALRQKIEDLERLNRLMVNRELKMIELKEELKKSKKE